MKLAMLKSKTGLKVYLHKSDPLQLRLCFEFIALEKLFKNIEHYNFAGDDNYIIISMNTTLGKCVDLIDYINSNI